MLYCKYCNFWVSEVLTDFLFFLQVLWNNEDKTRKILSKTFKNLERFFLGYCLFLPDSIKRLTSNITKPNRNNVFSILMEWLWRCEANIAKTKPHHQHIISQFSLLIFYKLQLFFKMSHNNLFKTYFGSEKYWFFGWKVSNLKKSFLSKNPVVMI